MASSDPPVVIRNPMGKAERVAAAVADATSGPVGVATERVATPPRPGVRSPRARAAGAPLALPPFYEVASTGALFVQRPRGAGDVPRRGVPSPPPPSQRSVSTMAARRRRPPPEPSLPSPPPAAEPPADPVLAHGVSSRQGMRPTMEDYHVATTFKSSLTSPLVGIYAIFDGHGGPLAAQTAAATFVPALTTGTCHFPNGDLAIALNATTARCEEAVLEASRVSRSYAGCTLTGLVVRRSELLCVNVGDSRVVLGRRGGTSALALSADHSTKLEGETERIAGAGGFIKNDKVMGLLATTRSLGDMDFKDHRGLHFPSSSAGSGPLITATPDITRTVLEEGDDFAILACDGLWSVLANKAAVRLAARALRRYNDPNAAADALVRSALLRGSTDNVTVVLVALKWTPRTHSPVFGGMFSLHGGSNSVPDERTSTAATSGVSLRNGVAALASLRSERSATDENRKGGWRRRVGLRGPTSAPLQK